MVDDGSVPPGEPEITEQIENCLKLIATIEVGVGTLEEELVDIKAQLNKLLNAPKVTYEELMPLQDRLQAIENKRIEGEFQNFIILCSSKKYQNAADSKIKSSLGKFEDSEGGIPPGQARLVELLEECHDIKQKIINKIG